MNRITQAARMAAPAAALAAGLVAVLAPAGPAAAHGTTQHTVAMSGTLEIVDYDSGNDDRCTRTFSLVDNAQLPLDPQVQLRAGRECDEVRVTVTASGTLSTSGSVSVSGTVLVEDRDCFLTCGYDLIGSRSFTRTLSPSGTSTVTGTIDDGNQGSAHYTLALANSD